MVEASKQERGIQDRQTLTHSDSVMAQKNKYQNQMSKIKCLKNTREKGSKRVRRRAKNRADFGTFSFYFHFCSFVFYLTSFYFILFHIHFKPGLSMWKYIFNISTHMYIHIFLVREHKWSIWNGHTLTHNGTFHIFSFFLARSLAHSLSPILPFTCKWYNVELFAMLPKAQDLAHIWANIQTEDFSQSFETFTES